MAVRGRLTAGVRRYSSAGVGTAQPGTTPHSLFILVVVEVIALVWLRRQFRSAHGG